MPESLAAPIPVVQDPDEDVDTLRAAAAASGLARITYRVASGGDGPAVLRGAGDVRLPHLSVLGFINFNSHCVDGRQPMAATKTDDGLNEIPMVVLTTSANPKDVAFCHQAGANAPCQARSYGQYLLPLGSSLNEWFESAALHTDTLKVD